MNDLGDVGRNLLRPEALCLGGPFDGRFVLIEGRSGFPWPRGWYYLRYELSADSPLLRVRDEPPVFVWDGEPDHFLPQDQEWLRHNKITVREP